MKTLKLVLIGIALGIANIIPGVSGGTLAVAFGVYAAIIELICPNIKKIFSMWKFWLPLGAGLASGILIFSKLINRFLLLYPSAALWFFTGIVLGSLPFIASQTYYKTCGIQTAHAKTENSAQKIPTGRILCVCAAFIAAFSLMIYMKYAKSGDFTSEAQTAVNAALWIKLCLYTAAAAAAMIIPGISGSFLLVIFGMYNTVIRAVADLNIALLIPVALGAAAGLLGGAALIRLLLRKFCAQTYGAILGLVAGSLIVLYPGISVKNEMFFSALLFIAGTVLSYMSSRGKNDGREGSR